MTYMSGDEAYTGIVGGVHLPPHHIALIRLLRDGDPAGRVTLAQLETAGEIRGFSMSNGRVYCLADVEMWAARAVADRSQGENT